jgi:cytochrome P450/NADPH-cytochrome P450 reductase
MPKPMDEGVDVTNTNKEEKSTPKTSKVKYSMEASLVANFAIDVKLPAITFLFGTQTGTSQDYADQLSKQAKSFGFKDVTFCQMDKWKVLKEGKYTGPKDKLESRELLVAVTATYK